MNIRTCVPFRFAGTARAAWLVYGLACCGAPATPSSFQSSVVVGSDDRLEPFRAPHAVQEEVRSAAALVFANHLRWQMDGGVTLDAPLLSDDLNVCLDEPFASEPVAAFCSGVLIEKNLVATAGHCLGDDPVATCRQMFAVFGYAYASPSAVQLQPDLVFACKNVVALDRSDADIAIIELERPAEVRPAVVSPRPIATGDLLVVASYPSGLPMKVELAAAVVSAAPGIYFEAATDTFAGSSGGPLFDDAGGLVGLVTRGDTDYWVDQSCMRANQVAISREQHQRVDAVVSTLCGSAHPSATLCGQSSVCGDGQCGAEEYQTCARDCPTDSCGDGICEISERQTCTADCSRFVNVPGNWTLPAEEYVLDVPMQLFPNGGCNLGRAPYRGWGSTTGLIVLWTLFRRRTRRRHRAGTEPARRSQSKLNR